MIENEHKEPAAIVYEQNEEHTYQRETQKKVKAALKVTVERIRELKKVRGTPGQPGWQGSNLGLELEQAKGLATILCMARARARGRKHFVRLPRDLHLPAGGVKSYGQCLHVDDQSALARLCDDEVRARFPDETADPVAPSVVVG